MGWRTERENRVLAHLRSGLPETLVTADLPRHRYSHHTRADPGGRSGRRWLPFSQVDYRSWCRSVVDTSHRVERCEARFVCNVAILFGPTLGKGTGCSSVDRLQWPAAGSKARGHDRVQRVDRRHPKTNLANTAPAMHTVVHPSHGQVTGGNRDDVHPPLPACRLASPLRMVWCRHLDVVWSYLVHAPPRSCRCAAPGLLLPACGSFLARWMLP